MDQVLKLSTYGPVNLRQFGTLMEGMALFVRRCANVNALFDNKLPMMSTLNLIQAQKEAKGEHQIWVHPHVEPELCATLKPSQKELHTWLYQTLFTVSWAWLLGPKELLAFALETQDFTAQDRRSLLIARIKKMSPSSASSSKPKKDALNPGLWRPVSPSELEIAKSKSLPFWEVIHSMEVLYDLCYGAESQKIDVSIGGYHIRKKTASTRKKEILKDFKKLSQKALIDLQKQRGKK